MVLESKRQCRISENEDRISRLPDEVLSHILSFLPLQDAFRTTLLSRRWKDIWLSVANIDIFEPCYPHRKLLACRKSFASFMNRFMILREHAIKIFRLYLDNPYSPSEVETWIWAAILHNVEELDLLCYAHRKYRIELPQTLFCCGSLKVLMIDSVVDLKIPKSVCLPSLQVVHLGSDLCLHDGTISNLLSGSPIIEELVIDSRDTLKVQTAGVSIVSVKSLSLKSFKFHKFGEVKYRLVLDAPKLKLLELKSDHFMFIDIRNASTVVEATIDFSCHYRYNNILDGPVNQIQIVQLLCQICNVKVLSLSSNIIKPVFDASNQNLPHFHNLTQLEVKPYYNEWLNLLDLLGASPNLKILILSKEFSLSNPHLPLNEERTVPQCFISSLELFTFTKFQGSEVEMKTVQYMLRNAKVLKELRILTYCSGEEKSDLVNKLLMLRRDENECEIRVS